MPTKTVLPFPSSAGQEERKYNKMLMGQDKGRARSLPVIVMDKTGLIEGKITLIY